MLSDLSFILFSTLSTEFSTAFSKLLWGKFFSLAFSFFKLKRQNKIKAADISAVWAVFLNIKKGVRMKKLWNRSLKSSAW